MNVGIMCCGCSKVLKDGKAVYPKHGWMEATTFDSREAADEAAKAAGWSVADADGANHRCPDCVNVTHKRRGAYIENGIPV